MATVYLELDPQMATIRAADANKPGYRENNGTNFSYPFLGMIDGADTQAFFRLDLKLFGASNSSMTIEIEWNSDQTTTSYDVVWGFALACVTPETDTTDLSAKAFGTEQTVQDTILSANARRIHRCSCTLTNLDSAAAGDYAILRIRRLALDANDDHAGTVNLLAGRVSFSDT